MPFNFPPRTCGYTPSEGILLLPLESREVRLRIFNMGYSEIKENVKSLSERERRELVAYIVQLDESTEKIFW